MEKLKYFFWLCSGAHHATLEKSPSESSKYAGIGATIFFTGLFAAIAGGYDLYTVFDNAWIASLFGVVWGLLIFNLDRYIVSSMRKEGSKWQELGTAVPRILLALLISVVIAKPLELKIFDKEIRAELALMQQEGYDLQVEKIKSRFTETNETLNDEVKALRNEINDKAEKRDELRRIAQEEADGTGGTKKRNAGPIYRIKKADADRVEEELIALSAQNEKVVQEKLAMRSSNDSTMAAEIAAIQTMALDGPAGRMEALSRLTSKSSAIWWANFFIMLLFIAVETAPVFVKLISPKGPYDNLLKVEEYGFEGKRTEELAKTNASIRQRSKDLPAHESEYINDRLETGLNQT